jgi:hypothetical protein
MAYTNITALPTAPSRARPSTFAAEGDAFLAALATFVTEVNASGSYIDGVGTAADTDAATSTAQAAAAATSATNSANSATASATSASNSSISETNAAASAAAAAASFDSFDDRYLGAKASDPATDNDGDSLSGGMIYYNTGDGNLKLYNGSAWVAAVLDPSGALMAANNLSDLASAATAITNLGITATAAELNYVDGVTSNIQTQIDNIGNTVGTLTKSFANGESSVITLSSTVSPTAIVAVTKEVSQTGVSSKGAWDVASDAANYELYNQAPSTSLTLQGWDISTSSFVQSFSVVTQDGSPHGVHFKSDGTKMFIIGSDGDDINEYNLSTAWDISTATFSQNGSISAQDTTPSDLFFKSDGTKVFIVGDAGDAIDEWDLSTAWDVSTLSFNQSFSVNSQDTSPQGLFFKPDGLRMYVSGQTNDKVYEYALTTAWDVSSASFSQDFSVALQETNPRGLSFKSDGTKMYVTGNNGQDVNEYNLSTAWDISTASAYQVFDVSSKATYPTGIYFRDDGFKMYIVGLTSDQVHEYDVSGPFALGTGSFASSDVGKRIFTSDGGEGVLTATDGSYSLSSAFGATTYTSGNWSLSGLDVHASNGVTLSGGGGLAQPTAQYLPALTSTGGQIDSQFWTDINSMTADDVDNDGQVYYAVSTDDRTIWSVAKASDGVRPIVRNNSGTWQYNSNATYGSTTYTNGTTNDEFATIAQAMTVAANQMDKAQVDAVTDGSHFTLGNTLDLAIIPYLASTGTAPTSDGVSINYDAAALNKGAILGTDYDYDVPATDKVRITSNAAQNLKIRIV